MIQLPQLKSHSVREKQAMCVNLKFFLIQVPAPGQVIVSVSSITATSISLSWSVASGRVASLEVVWRPTDRGTESTSGSLPGNTYTIHHLDSSTIYTVTVRATNVAGTTDSTPILFSTDNEVVFFILFWGGGGEGGRRGKIVW